MPFVIRPDDPRLTWLGTVSMQSTDEWATPWRIPFEERGLFPEPLVERAAMPAGVRIAFHSDTTLIRGTWVPHAEPVKLDLCCDGTFVASADLAGQDTFQFGGLPAQDKLVELWLPQFGPFRLQSLELSDGCTLRPHTDERPRWITYGSSITHCRTAASPTATWPAIVARERGLNLTCLGFGGQCHLDSMVARMMRDLPADFVSICVGINIQGGATLNLRTFRASIIGFVQIVREEHPTVPFAIMSPIFSPPRETQPNVVGLHLQQMRREVAAAVRTMQAHGDEHLYYVDGLDILGPDAAHLLPDDLHPNAEGYRLMGHNFLHNVIPKVFP